MNMLAPRTCALLVVVELCLFLTGARAYSLENTRWKTLIYSDSHEKVVQVEIFAVYAGRGWEANLNDGVAVFKNMFAAKCMNYAESFLRGLCGVFFCDAITHIYF